MDNGRECVPRGFKKKQQPRNDFRLNCHLAFQALDETYNHGEPKNSYTDLERTLHFSRKACSCWDVWTCPQRQHSLSSYCHTARGEWRIVEEGDDWEQTCKQLQTCTECANAPQPIKKITLFFFLRILEIPIYYWTAVILQLLFQGRFALRLGSSRSRPHTGCSMYTPFRPHTQV